MEYKQTFAQNERLGHKPAEGLLKYMDDLKILEDIDIKLRDPESGKVYDNCSLIGLIFFAEKLKNIEVIVQGNKDETQLKSFAESFGAYFSSEQEKKNREKFLRANNLSQ